MFIDAKKKTLKAVVQGGEGRGGHFAPRGKRGLPNDETKGAF